MSYNLVRKEFFELILASFVYNQLTLFIHPVNVCLVAGLTFKYIGSAFKIWKIFVNIQTKTTYCYYGKKPNKHCYRISVCAQIHVQTA